MVEGYKKMVRPSKHPDPEKMTNLVEDIDGWNSNKINKIFIQLPHSYFTTNK